MAARAWRPNSRRWQVTAKSAAAGELARRLGSDPLVAQVLYNRGVTDLDDARAFLEPKLSDLHDPQLLGGAVAAAQRIAAAVAAGHRIVIYGDYDVDGITAVAILHACLRMVGADVHFYVPHRLEEGYGVNAEALDKIIADGTKLLITVDCGISAGETLRRATAAGVEVVVTDHHGLGPELPDVAAVVHPRLPGSEYPNGDLAGAGVAFKLAWQLARTLCGSDRVDEPMRDFLVDATSLAALGTIADIVPLVGENRSLAVHGLRGLTHSRHPGICALLESANLAGGPVDAFHVGFVLAPRINACGRMGHARLAVEMLTDAPPDRCRKIAQCLVQQNAERQRTERAIAAEATEMVTERGLDAAGNRAIVLWSQDWHAGVIGIVAARLVDRFTRPAILLSVNGDGRAQGSGRSVPGFDMREALAACSRHLLNFGGHAMAGGLRLESEKLEAFAEDFIAYANAHLSSEQLAAPLAIDVESPLAALNHRLADHLSRMAPFGQGNAEPVVVVRGCRVLTPPRRMGRSGGTVGLMLGQGSARMRAVGFGMGDLADELVGVHTIDVAGMPILNTFNGRTSVELKLKDVRWE